MIKKVVYTVFFCLSFFSLFGQSESGGVPVFISDMRTHIVELQTSCVRRPGGPSDRCGVKLHRRVSGGQTKKRSVSGHLSLRKRNNEKTSGPLYLATV